MAWKETEKGSARTAASLEMPSGTGIEHRIVRRQQLGPRPGCAGDHADMDARPEVALREAPAQIEVSRRAGRAVGSMPRGAQVSHGLSTTRWPTSRPRACRSEGHHLGDNLMAGDMRERGERRHRVVDVAGAEVPQHQLGIGAADPREDGSGDDPVRTYQPGVVDLVQPEGQAGQHRLQLVGRRRPGVLGGRGARRGGPSSASTRSERSAPDRPARPPAVASAIVSSSMAWSVMARMPIMKLSKSAVFISTIAFMSGR